MSDRKAPRQVAGASTRSAAHVQGRLPSATSSLRVQLPSTSSDQQDRRASSSSSTRLAAQQSQSEHDQGQSDAAVLTSSILAAQVEARSQLYTHEKLVDGVSSDILRQMLTVGRRFVLPDDQSDSTNEEPPEGNSGKIIRSLFLAVLEERHSLELCAYPACRSSPCRPRRSADKHGSSSRSASSYRINRHTHSIEPETRLEVGGAWTFCSDACWARATWITRWILGDDGHDQPSGQPSTLLFGGNASGGRWEVSDDTQQSIELLEDLEARGEVQLLAGQSSSSDRTVPIQRQETNPSESPSTGEAREADRLVRSNTARNASANALAARATATPPPPRSDRPRNPKLPRGMSTVRGALPKGRAGRTTASETTATGASTAARSSKGEDAARVLPQASESVQDIRSPTTRASRCPISERPESTLLLVSRNEAKDVASIFGDLRIVERGRDSQEATVGSCQHLPVSDGEGKGGAGDEAQEALQGATRPSRVRAQEEEEEELDKMLASQRAEEERGALSGQTSEDLWDFAKLARKQMNEESKTEAVP
ncbi:Protein of unknown function DUF408 [Ceraceosorus bombacis]|uniref:RTR1-type domain-containing protein n=1 Tax=Ceraceosorus bombacis TaxID=401625 RepID=A0A0P1BLP7_9BASI|nr:Protein of unknown function DUF408 [Ceraceosorus bombacis]